MPSGVSDTVIDRILDVTLGSGANTALLGSTIYLDLLTTAPSDDNGTDAVSWGQGRTAVTVTDGTTWPAASGRAKISAEITCATNSSGTEIDVVAFGWYTASTSGTYLGGGPVAGDSLPIADGVTPVVTATLAGPPPS